VETERKTVACIKELGKAGFALQKSVPSLFVFVFHADPTTKSWPTITRRDLSWTGTLIHLCGNGKVCQLHEARSVLTTSGHTEGYVHKERVDPRPPSVKFVAFTRTCRRLIIQTQFYLSGSSKKCLCQENPLEPIFQFQMGRFHTVVLQNCFHLRKRTTKF
jgi:hypothetical protein